MPQQHRLASRGDALWQAESLGLWAIGVTDAALTEADWGAIRRVFNEHPELTALVVPPVRGLVAQQFTAAWSVLPARLASLAIAPPEATCLVARSDEATRCVLPRPNESDRSGLWRCLIEFAKRRAVIDVRPGLLHDPLGESSAINGADAACLPELLAASPRRERSWLFDELRRADPADICGHVASPADATAVLAGLWLLHGDADASHRLSQSIEDAGRHRCGNYWHAIMHRQEPDYGNSKYWFRRVGQHPIFRELAERADEILAAVGSEPACRWRGKLGVPSGWNPFAFVDWCEAVADSTDAAQIDLVRRLQFVEMHLLLRATYSDATSL